MFRLFGFDVAVRPGFLLFCGLIIFVYQDSFGFWLAGALAGFTLLHELGHAVAARSAGAKAAISLDFMAGYTSFQPTRAISRARRALISVSGPATQIAISVAVLAAMGVNPLDSDSVRDTEPSLAIWWAGPVVGLLNLVPVLPLDGGHIAQAGLEGVLRRSALREMAVASLALTLGVAVLMAVFGRTDFVLFIAFLLIAQFQLVQATSSRRRPMRAPSGGWADTDTFLSAQSRPSPWQQAHAAVIAGDPERARELILDDLASPSGGRWAPPFDAPADALRAVVDTLPARLPGGNAISETVLVQVLLAVGQIKRAGEYAAEGFGRHRTPLLATVVVRAAARLGDPDNALQWVYASTDTIGDASPGERAAALHVLDNAPDLASLRSDPRFQAARAGV